MYPCSFMVEAGYRGIPLNGTTLRISGETTMAFSASEQNTLIKDVLTARRHGNVFPVVPSSRR